MKNARFAFTDFWRNIAFVDSSVSAEKTVYLREWYLRLATTNFYVEMKPIEKYLLLCVRRYFSMSWKLAY